MKKDIDVGLAGPGIYIKDLKFEYDYIIERLSCGGLKLYNNYVILEVREAKNSNKLLGN